MKRIYEMMKPGSIINRVYPIRIKMSVAGYIKSLFEPRVCVVFAELHL
jgi:hypothetical protein